MIALGAALAGLSVALLVVTLHPTSAVARRLERIAPPPVRSAGWRAVPDVQLRHAGLALDADRFLAVKVASALSALLGASLLALILPVGPAAIVVGGYVGFVLPSLVVDRRASTRRAEAERAVGIVVERLEALVSAGRPAETALALLATRPSGAVLLDRLLQRTAESYALGAPLFRTLAANARDDGLPTCAAIADDLERARDLGTGSIGVIRERRATLRSADRARSLEAAAQVEGKLMLVLVLCYVPALALLVIAPLFLGLLAGLTG